MNPAHLPDFRPRRTLRFQEAPSADWLSVSLQVCDVPAADLSAEPAYELSTLPCRRV